MALQVPGGGECRGGCRAALDFPCEEGRSEPLPLTFCPRALTERARSQAGHCAFDKLCKTSRVQGAAQV